MLKAVLQVDGAGGGDGASVICDHWQVWCAVVLKDGELRLVVLYGVRCAVRDLATELISEGDRGHVLDELGTKKVEWGKKQKQKQIDQVAQLNNQFIAEAFSHYFSREPPCARSKCKLASEYQVGGRSCKYWPTMATDEVTFIKPTGSTLIMFWQLFSLILLTTVSHSVWSQLTVISSNCSICSSCLADILSNGKVSMDHCVELTSAKTWCRKQWFVLHT